MQHTKAKGGPGSNQYGPRGTSTAGRDQRGVQQRERPAGSRGLAAQANDEAAGAQDSAEPAPPVAVLASRARKGDLVLIETEHSYDLLNGGRRRTISYQLCVVGAATRDGTVKATLDPSAYAAGRQPLQLSMRVGRRWVLGQDRVDVDGAMRSLAAERSNQFGTVQDFETFEEAQEFVSGHLKGKSGEPTEGSPPSSQDAGITHADSDASTATDGERDRRETRAAVRAVR